MLVMSPHCGRRLNLTQTDTLLAEVYLYFPPEDLAPSCHLLNYAQPAVIAVVIQYPVLLRRLEIMLCVVLGQVMLNATM